ncbi:MAG: adenosylhomocysteinase [Candidatus Eisenbacteria bacterium]|nr:adenosylhomocysteinase [Candidatus Eisenbacteria bacterium]
MGYDIKDIALADAGLQRIQWAARRMPVLRSLHERFAAERPLEGQTIAACLHITSETANLASLLRAGGARVMLCASNPLSTQDDVAAALAKHLDCEPYCIRGEDRDTYYSHIHALIDADPRITMDDGCDLVSTLHSERREKLQGVIGGTEETTTGVIRLRSMESESALEYPIIAVNAANTKHLFDNRYGTGQSTVDGVLRLTNMLIAGATAVVAGYGWCGRGTATRLRGMGANVIVTEIDPVRALEAAMDGFRVMPMAAAAPLGDLFITLTGNTSVLRREHFEKMKDGAIVANSGHFNVEIDIPALAEMAREKREARPLVQEYQLPSGGHVSVLADGRLVNLSGAEGHPAMVMDMSFANQALSVEHLAREHKNLEKRVYVVPPEIDSRVAELKLASMGITHDALTDAQRRYLASWREGT